MHAGVIAAVIGVGETQFTKKSARTTYDLGLEAALSAINDAGLSPNEIDGIISFPFSISVEEFASALNVKCLRYSTQIAMGGAGSVASLRHAKLAVESGAAKNVLIVRARNGSSGGRIHERPSQLPAQTFRKGLEHPYGINTAAQRYSLICRRYRHQYGLERETLGEIALAARFHANLNERAMMHTKLLTLEQYLSGRLIADPYSLFDCCLESDGACAIIISSTSRSGTSATAKILAAAEGRPKTPDDLFNRPDYLAIGLDIAATTVWNETSFAPSDMDAAMIYDCFTFEVLHQLESAGFAEKGQGANLIRNGGLKLGGKLPVNTHGGLLSEAHMSGLNHVIEAVRQLRGTARCRQIADASRIAVSGWGDLSDGSFAILSR